MLWLFYKRQRPRRFENSQAKRASADARYARLFAAAVMGAASISAANARDGFHDRRQHYHDGTYAVYITTNRGDCDKHYHWMILVSGGRVSSAGHTPMNASGHINPRGNVHLTFKRFHHAATPTGRLMRRFVARRCNMRGGGLT
jgi:hypothetical protein